MTFAPAHKPRIAIAVVVKHGGHGGSAAAPIAAEIIKAYLADLLVEDPNEKKKKKKRKKRTKKPAAKKPAPKKPATKKPAIRKPVIKTQGMQRAKNTSRNPLATTGLKARPRTIRKSAGKQVNASGATL